MSSNKIQPLDKTIITEFNIKVADLHQWSKKMNGAQAARVARDGAFNQGDLNVSPTRPFTIFEVRRMIAIQSWKPIVLSLKNETGSIENIPCSGLFIMYGSFDEVTVKAQMEGDPVRIAYIYA